MGYTGLMDMVYYKEAHFDLLFPIWFKKFILRTVRPVVTWVQNFKNIRAWTELEHYLSPYSKL